jgi:threonine/homoserine/homoserine lactone efflux protein
VTIDLLAALAMGLGLGVLTGMPLGVINVAIVDAAIAREKRHATGLAIGGALADATHTLVAFLGLGQLVTARPQYTRYLAIAAAVVIVGFAIASWRRRRTVTAERATTTTSVVGSILSGIALTLPNPAALGAWVAVAAMTWPHASIPITITLALGVGVGSATWFLALGRLVAKVRPDHRALRVIPQVALVAFVAIAIVGVVRTL